MGIWIADPILRSDEVVTFEGLANFFRGRRTIGGKVTVTDRRLLFVPNRLDALLRGRNVEANLEDVSRVHIEPPGTPVARERGLGARLRPQVEIDCDDKTIVITVHDPEALKDAVGPLTR